MKLAKSLLLGSVAGLAAAAGAQAADLPMRKAAPVEYVRVCSVHGAGFFYIPGSDTCIKIGGRVRAEYRYLEPVWTNPGLGMRKDATGTRALGRINVDARTATEWGTLRAFVQVDVNAYTGVYNSQLSAAGVEVGPTSDTNGSVSLDKAYIQWAGITAGRISSFFDFYATAINFGSGVMGSLGSDDGSVNVLAYTATFGNGFSATVALEDRSSMVQRGFTNGGIFDYGLAGQRMPSVVANLRVDQGWGSAQLSGAVQQLNSINIGDGLAANPNGDGVTFVGPGSGALGYRTSDEYGWAIQAGVKFNLPMLAAGDALWLQAAYADGALGRLGLTGSPAIGPVGGLSTDALLVNGSLKKTRGWGVTAALLHYWTPSVRQAVFGNYTSVDFSGSTIAAYSLPGGSRLVSDYKIWTVGTNVIWSPVKAFDIGVEVLYQKLDPQGRVALPNGGSTSSEDIWEARLRFQRDF